MIMNMKNNKFLIIVVILIIAVAGYFAVNRFYPSKTAEPTINTTTNTTNTNSTNSQGKLDINVVCQNALAYMTFENQASANKFIVECKEGKHPEVIEQYKAQFNLGAGAAI